MARVFPSLSLALTDHTPPDSSGGDRNSSISRPSAAQGHADHPVPQRSDRLTKASGPSSRPSASVPDYPSTIWRS